MTPKDNIIPGARNILNDEVSAEYRDSDHDYIRWINDCLAAMVDLRPDLFTTSAEHTCTAGAEQTCSFLRMRSIQEVPRIVGGSALTPADRATLDAFRPSWYSDAQAAAVNWLPHPDGKTKFYVYPPAPAGQKVEVRFIQAHATLAAVTDAINLPENYAPAIQAWCINRAESKDDEAINSNRAQAFLSEFAVMIGAQGEKQNG